MYDLKNFGIHDAENVPAVGANAKMNEFCAAMGLCNLRHVDEEIVKRHLVDKKYRELLSGIKGIIINPFELYDENDRRNYAYFPILIDEKLYGHTRDELFEYLKINNIYVRKYFYPLTSDYEAYSGMFDSTKTPIAKYVSERILTLPMYGNLREEEINRICDIIADMKG